MPLAALLRALLLASSALLSSAQAARAETWVVRSSGFGDFTTIQAAVDAAQDGDRIVVAGSSTHSYDGFQVVARRLWIAALPGEPVQVRGPVRVADVAARQVVTLSGLYVSSAGTESALPALTVENCVGAVRLQDCLFEAGTPTPVHSPEGVRVSGSANVVLVRCTLQGGAGSECFGVPCGGVARDAGDGGVAVDSLVVLLDCTLRGGSCGVAGDADGGEGGAGWRAVGLESVLSGCDLRGGNGGSTFLAPGGDGGPGLVVANGTQVHLTDTNAVGGGGGNGMPLGNPGSAVLTEGSGSAIQHAGTLRRLGAPAIATGALPLALQVDGEPGDLVWVAEARRPGLYLGLAAVGPWVLPFPTPLPVQPHAIVPASGTALVTLPAGWEPVGSDRGVHLQLQGQSAGGVPFHGDAALVSVVDCPGSGGPDCDSDGVEDLCELMLGTQADANMDGIPDECGGGPFTRHVDASAAPGGNGSAAHPFQDLASAFFVALDGDTILLADGLYQGPANRDLDFAGRALTIRSSGGAAACTLDLQLAGRAFRLSANPGPAGTSRIEGITFLRGSVPGQGLGGAIWTQGQPLVVEGCEFRECSAHRGGALASDGPGSLVVRSSVFTEGLALFAGAALYLEDTEATVEDSLFTDLVSERSGGAVFAEGGELVVSDCEFARNRVEMQGIYGGLGGSLKADAAVTVARCSFTDDYAEVEGGSVSANFITVIDSSFLNCSAGQLGGAISVRVGATLFRGCSFLGNQAQGGGAVWAGFEARPTVQRCLFALNVAAAGSGGGLLLRGEEEGAVQTARIDHSFFVDNRATEGGGGIAAREIGELVLDHVLLARNEAVIGGGLLLASSQGSLTSSTVADNVGTIRAGVHLSGGSDLSVANSILWGNVSGDGFPLRLDEMADTLVVQRSDVQGGIASVAAPAGGSVVWGPGNLDLDPQFLFPGTLQGDYTLGAGSPCLDAGDNALVVQDVFDWDGDGNVLEPVPRDLGLDPRFVDDPAPDTGSGAPPLVDLGAYERQ